VTAALIFAFTYIAFSVGRVPGLRSDRVAAAIVGGVLLVALGVLSVKEAQAAVDGATLGLLFGMMVLSAALDASGTFALLGWWVTRRARTPFALLVAVTLASAVLSAFLINDVVCIAFTPLVLRIAAAVRRDPKPYLLALAISSNIGSVATPTGNPQNILIASLSGVSYARFAMAMAPVASVSLVVAVAVIWLVHRRSMGGPFTAGADERRPTVYRRWVRKSAVVMAGVLVAFVAGVPPVIAALLGAAALMLTRAVHPKRLYARVDWTLLALFTGLFVVVAGVEKTGLAERLLGALRPLRPESVWGLTAIAAILSNVVSNVPAVMVLKSLVPHLADPTRAWLTLAMSSTLAGNLTLPGSLATVIVAERAKGRASLSFVDFLEVGAPTAVVSLAIGAAWLALVG
jgi:Na+/H+ antiporter NhaD/arsenite permease-like protein